MELKLNKTAEEQKAYHKHRFELVDEDTDMAWVCRFTDDQIDKIEEEYTPLIREGNNWESSLKLLVYGKIQPKTSKIKSFKSSNVGSLPVAIDMIFAEVFKLARLDQVKVEQTKLVMPPNETIKKVVPKKK